MAIGRITAAAVLMAASLAMAPGAAPAQQVGQNYLSIGAGPDWYRDADVSGGGVNASVDYDTGWGVVGAFGHRFTPNVRAEVELGYRSADVDSITSSTDTSGGVDAPSLMANVYYDFDAPSAFTPYLGLGVGAAKVDADNVKTLGASTANDSDTVFAYQGIAGLSYDLKDALALFGEYRYFATQDPDFTLASGTKVGGEFSDHRILVGLRWSFGGKEPAPMAEPKPAPKPVAQAPAPAPAPKPKPAAKPVPRTYLVFFDWDKSAIRPDAAAILREVAANYPKASVVRVDATGHADRSGPDAYNMGLSKRRAEAVKAELARLGVPAGDVALAWKGERQPLVPTDDGVREPQNRRVEIVFK